MSDGFGETAILEESRKPGADLSAQIEQTVQRDPLDRVKCVRVFGDNYRCNWWAEPIGAISTTHVSAWGALATSRIRKSQFLNVILVDGGLVIKEILPPTV